MAPEVGGSKPLIHPIFEFSIFLGDYAPVAQLDRAPDFESVGRRFESCRAYSIPSTTVSMVVDSLPGIVQISLGFAESSDEA